MKVYLDNAATTPIASEVIEEIQPYLNNYFGNPSSTHAFGRKTKNAIEIYRKKIADLINAKNNEIIFTSGGTEADNMALRCAVYDLKVKRIITTKIEHHAVLHTAESLRDYHDVEIIFLETDEKGVYAIGDITDGPWLAHKASHEGILCVEKIAGHKNLKPIDKTSIPGCTYCRPQVASIGMTEIQARSKNLNLKIGKFPFIGNGKAIALGDSEGLIKTIFNKDTGELIGAHMVGPEVTELIQGFSIAKKLETTEQELMHTIFPHPTLSEGIHESVLDAYNQAIHY